MKHHLKVVFAAAGMLAAAPALADDSCAARIDALGERLDAAAEQSISTSSAGQGVAAARETQAREDTAGDRTAVVPYQDDDDEAEAVEAAEDAGDGGDRVMQAIALMDQAETAAADGDEAACLDAVAEAEALLDDDGDDDADDDSDAENAG